MPPPTVGECMYSECSDVQAQVEFASQADVLELVEIEQQCYAQPWDVSRFEQELATHCSYILVQRIEGDIVAYICFWHMGEEVEIHNIACAPNNRRCGAAQALMSCLRNWCVEHEVKEIFLEVRSSNSAAIDLYNKYNFIQCGRRPRYYSDGEDALLMCCSV